MMNRFVNPEDGTCNNRPEGMFGDIARDVAANGTCARSDKAMDRQLGYFIMKRNRSDGYDIGRFVNFLQAWYTVYELGLKKFRMVPIACVLSLWYDMCLFIGFLQTCP